MRTYNKHCPICGHLNKNLYLEETDGWMECDYCHKDTRVLMFGKRQILPVFTMEGIIRHMQANGGTI